MSDRTKKVLRILGVGVIWVYILSIRIGGESIFYYANNILVQNRIVEAIDHSVADALDHVVAKAKVSFHSLTGREDKG